MADLTTGRVVVASRKTIKKLVYPLGAAQKAVDGCMAVIDTARPGYIWSPTVITTEKAVAWFTATVDNTAGASGALGVGVELFRERECQIWDSVGGGGAITIANLFQLVYIASNHELTTVSTGASAYGIVWDFAPQGYPGGVVVEPLF
jgi:pyruvate/2-oxoacid:ferredoxin oxidoreductase beta subunit